MTAQGIFLIRFYKEAEQATLQRHVHGPQGLGRRVLAGFLRYHESSP